MECIFQQVAQHHAEVGFRDGQLAGQFQPPFHRHAELAGLMVVVPGQRVHGGVGAEGGALLTQLGFVLAEVVFQLLQLAGLGQAGDDVKVLAEIVAELAAPVAAEFGCELWDTEYVREAGQWFLRLYLDKDGGVDILDCENVSRRVSDLLDEADPIEGSYIFEVSSAGAERQLKRPSDFEKFLGSPVLLKTYQNRDGRKEFPGVLKEYDGGAVVLEMGKQELRFEKNEVAMVRLRIVF